MSLIVGQSAPPVVAPTGHRVGPRPPEPALEPWRAREHRHVADRLLAAPPGKLFATICWRAPKLRQRVRTLSVPPHRPLAPPRLHPVAHQLPELHRHLDGRGRRHRALGRRRGHRARQPRATAPQQLIFCVCICVSAVPPPLRLAAFSAGARRPMALPCTRLLGADSAPGPGADGGGRETEGTARGSPRPATAWRRPWSLGTPGMQVAQCSRQVRPRRDVAVWRPHTFLRCVPVSAPPRPCARLAPTAAEPLAGAACLLRTGLKRE